MKRYVIEGEWSGYRSSQQRIVHREVIKPTKAYLPKWQNLQAIQYTDGTTLNITMREAKPREKIKQILGYKSLIRDALYSGESWYVIRPSKVA